MEHAAREAVTEAAVIIDLAEDAFQAGWIGATHYMNRGWFGPPPTNGRPVSLTQLLKGSSDAPTEEELKTVETEWQRGWSLGRITWFAAQSN